MSDPNIANVVDFLIVAVITAIGGYLLRYGRRTARFFKRLASMVDDWHGHDADVTRGIPKQASFPEWRAFVTHELQRNGGVKTDPATGRVLSGSQKDISAAVLEQLQQLASTLGAQLGGTDSERPPD